MNSKFNVIVDLIGDTVVCYIQFNESFVINSQLSKRIALSCKLCSLIANWFDRDLITEFLIGVLNP